MTEYHKIDTVFKRNQRGKVVEGEYARSEFGYLAENEWVFTEKVDGMNVRLHYDGSAEFRGNEHAYVAGRTDAAQLPPALLRHLVELLKLVPFERVFPRVTVDEPVVLYGEGYGAGIQRGGQRYLVDAVGFVVFDVRVGPWWLRRENVEEVVADLGLTTVPVLGQGTLHDAIERTRAGFRSARWPGVEVAEGMVLRPSTELFDRAGRRIIAKIKHRDLDR